ncbi:hypothetical protein OSTOST_08631 [Ostertagia ostertagi]
MHLNAYLFDKYFAVFLRSFTFLSISLSVWVLACAKRRHVIIMKAAVVEDHVDVVGRRSETDHHILLNRSLISTQR